MWISNTKLSQPAENFSVLCGLKISFVIRETVLVEVNTIKYAATLKFRFVFSCSIQKSKGQEEDCFPWLKSNSLISLIILAVRCRGKRGGWGAAVPIWTLMGTVGKLQRANPKPGETHSTPHLSPIWGGFANLLMNLAEFWANLAWVRESGGSALVWAELCALFLSSRANVKFRMWETNTDPESWRWCF